MLGTCFNDRFPSDLAFKYVHETDLSLAQVAFLLGYAKQPTFNLAFKRWTARRRRNSCKSRIVYRQCHHRLGLSDAPPEMRRIEAEPNLLRDDS